jgi:hypothetical protein
VCGPEIDAVEVEFVCLTISLPFSLRLLGEAAFGVANRAS